MILLLIPVVLVGLCLVLWGLSRLEDGIPTKPDTHQHYLNDYTIHEGEDRP